MRTNLEDNVARGLLMLAGLKLGYVIQTITGNFTIPTDAPVVQEFDATATPRNITLPALKKGLVHVIVNGSSSTALLTVKSAAGTTVGVLAQGDVGIYICNGATWSDHTSSADASIIQGITAGTVSASKAVVVGTAKQVDVLNITSSAQLGSTTSATLGFYGATAVGQPAAASQSACVTTPALTALTSGETLAGVISGFNTLVTRCNNIVALANRLQADLVTEGLIKGSA